MKIAALNPVRRQVLKLGAAACSTGMFAFPGVASGAVASAKLRRYNVLDPQNGPRMLASYRLAVSAMLALPFEDPRNWYRHATIHTLDCPHGNWWFLPWHRGYLGWFEQVCRDLSGDPYFALPYWDWSQVAAIPDGLFDGVLNPDHAAFIATGAAFQTRMKTALDNAGYWKRPNGAIDNTSQYGQLVARNIPSSNDFWISALQSPPGPYFFDQPKTRGLSRANPGFTADTRNAVSLATLYPALNARDFTSFGSPKSADHSAAVGSGILEGQPHNYVHNCVGTTNCNFGELRGFMVDMLSSIDPLFYLHHANIDRLWDVWTRKQARLSLPIAPDGYSLRTTLADQYKSAAEKASDYYKWAREPFLFFTDKKGVKVTKNKAGDYLSIGDFNYDYQPGSGEDVVKPLLRTQTEEAQRDIRRYVGKIRHRAVTRSAPGNVLVQLPNDILVNSGSSSQSLVARITLNYPPGKHGAYMVVLGGPADIADIDVDSPYYATTLMMFGHHAMNGPFTFIIPIGGPVNYLHRNRLLEPGGGVPIRVLPRTGGMPHHAEEMEMDMDADTDSDVQLVSVLIEAY
ncbi:MAG: tyrosinase family protein [Pseudomonadota bacterium]|nr:tyrosinase family protein [Pseudomonadota bacterium]